MPKLLTKLRNLPLTIVLTILIWMYAEAQFSAFEDNLPLTIHVAPIANDQSIRMIEPADGQFHIRVEGPRTHVGRFSDLARHTADARPGELGSLDVTPKYRLNRGTDNWIDSATAINALPYFRDNGLTVTAAIPPRIKLEADQLARLHIPILFRGNLPVKITPDHADVMMPQSVRDTVGEGHINVYARPLRDLDTLPRAVEQTIPAQLIVEGPAPTDERVVVSPQQATLTLTIPRQREQALDVPEVPVCIAAPPELLTRYNVEIRPKAVRITVAGPEKLLEPIRATLTQGRPTDAKIRAYIDLDPSDKPSATFNTRAVRYVFPPGLELQQNPDHVEFRLTPVGPPQIPATIGKP